MARFRVFAADVNFRTGSHSHSVSKTDAASSIRFGWAWDISHLVGFRAIQMLRASSTNKKHVELPNISESSYVLPSGELPGVKFIGPKAPDAVRVRNFSRQDREEARNWFAAEHQMIGAGDLLA